MLKQDVAKQTVMGTRGSNGTAGGGGGFVTDLTSDLGREHANGEMGKEWDFLPALARARQGGLCTCMLHERRCSRTECE